MNNVTKIVVGLEINKIDIFVLKYLQHISRFLTPKEIKFINIHREELPEEIIEKFPEIIDHIDDHYIKKMVEETTNINLFNTKISYEAIHGSVLEEILKSTNKTNVDLLVIGRKNDKIDRHLHYRKIIRKAASSVLIIPEVNTLSLKTILVPIDFSEYSKFSIKIAIELAISANAKLIIQNIYEIPTGYSKTGKSFFEFKNIMATNAQKKCSQFLNDLNFNGVVYDTIYTLNDHKSTSKTIESTINSLKPNLLILGSKGKNKFSSILVGSTAESMIGKRDITIPVLLTRIKTQTVSVWDALREF